MSEKIEELSSTLDTLIIECALNTAHLKTLTLAFHELSAHILKENELKNLRSNYYSTLYENSSKLLNSEGLVQNHSKIHKALFNLHSFVNFHLKED